MRPLFLLLCILVFPGAAATPPSQIYHICSSLRSGHFVHRLRDLQQAGGDTRFHIYRRDSSQLEVNESTGDTSWYSIRWTDTCSYELTLRATTLAFSESMLTDLKSEPLLTSIVGRGSDFYLFVSRRGSASSFSTTDTVRIMK